MSADVSMEGERDRNGHREEDSEDQVVDGESEATAGIGVGDHPTERWAGVVGFALFAGGLGVLLESPGLALAAAVGATFVGYARSIDPPDPSAATDAEAEVGIRIVRELDDPTPAVGDEVGVRVGVYNETGEVLPDVRIVDGVPPGLEVVEGSPRHGTALRPGAATAFTYRVRATRGEHEFRPAQVTVADPAGTTERELAVPADTALRCRPSLAGVEELPLRGVSSPAAGRVETDAGGDGIEFHSTREYHPGDPLNRIDWHRKAKLDELGTLEYRQERAATVMLLVDVRRSAYRAPSPGGYHAVERSVAAAGRAFGTLLDAGDHVGIASVGHPTEECWLSPALGRDQRARGRKRLSEHPAFSPTPPEVDLHASIREDRRAELRHRLVDRLDERLLPDAQVFLFSPCCDDFPATIARRLEAHGRPVTVISPDPTAEDEPRHDLARMEREDRIRDLRRGGVRVIDWSAEESLDAAVAHARRRWRS